MDVFAVNWHLSGSKSATFFTDISSAQLDWNAVLLRGLAIVDKRFATASAIRNVLRNRHEVNEWAFPELTLEQRGHRDLILDAVKSLEE